MKGIVQQASDHRYWAFWNSQKLSPKFEAKRSHISNLKQNLTNQLIELERHFNNLEINKFGEYNRPTTSWGAPRSSAPSKQTQSLHSLYSTINSQLAAAEKLSEHLSKQIAALNISSPASEKKNVTKELFESIGLEPKTDAFFSPDPKSYKLLPYSSKRSSASPGTPSKKQSWNCAPDAVNAFQLESVRRERDSLNKNWAHFEPSKTTVKRTSDKEQVRSNLVKAFSEAKQVFDSQLKAFDITPNPAGTRDFSIASSADFDSPKQAVGTANRSSSRIASFPSNTAFNNSQSLEQSPIKGIQEKSSKKVIDAQPKPKFKWTNDPLDQRSERLPNFSYTSQVSQSAGTQPFSFANPSIFSRKDEKFDSPSISNTVAMTSSRVPEITDNQSFSFAPPSIFSASNSNKDEKFNSASISNMVASTSSQISNKDASTSIQVPQSAGAQPFSFATSSIFNNSSSNKDRKFDLASISNTSASTSSQASNTGASTSLQVPQSVGAQPFSFATTTSLSKPTSVPTQMNFPGTVSPLKAASMVEMTSQSNQTACRENEVDTLSLLQPTNTNSLVPSSTLSPLVAQTNALSTSWSVSSFQFGSSMEPNIFSSPSKSDAPFSFSTELNPNSMLSQPKGPKGPASDDSSLNKIGSGLEPATPSTNNDAANDPPKEVSSLRSKISSEVNFHLSASKNVATSNTNISKLLQSTSQQILTTGSPPSPREESVPPSTTNESMLLAPSGLPPVAGSVMAMSSSIMTTERDESLDANLSQEDEMEEEAAVLDANSMLNMESLGSFSAQTIASSTGPKPNPFGSSFLPGSSGGVSPQLSWSSSSGQLFRPPSFNLPESQSPQLTQSTGSSSFTGSLSGGFSSFGQPAQLGAGQQALGSVLGSFGQSRQLGTGVPGFGFDSAASSSGSFSNSSGFASGGFAGAATGGGFAGAASGGGFAGVPTGGGFVGAASGGGFAGAASGGGFAGAASNIGGFAGIGGGGSGFGGVSSGGGFATGGFGGFNSFQGSGGGGGGSAAFSVFGSGNSTAGRPPAELLTQMRK